MEHKTKTPITNFEDLEVWKVAQDVAVEAYKLSKKFPEEEKYALTSQIKRASASISANIAEGFGRRSSKDKLHFLTIALGSLLETKNFIYLAIKLGYISKEESKLIFSKILSNQKLLYAFMRPLKEGE